MAPPWPQAPVFSPTHRELTASPCCWLLCSQPPPGRWAEFHARLLPCFNTPSNILAFPTSTGHTASRYCYCILRCNSTATLREELLISPRPISSRFYHLAQTFPPVYS